MAYTTINKSSDYFDIRTYSASGAGSISDLTFQPDFIWFKNRVSVGDHGLFDAIRGVTKYLQSNNNSTGLTGNGSNDFTAFTSNGFTYGSSAQLDTSTGTPCTWLWKANGTGSSNTDGSITSTVSANTTSGFSIVKYTGTGSNATVGHGLGVAPRMIIIKSLGTGENWLVGGTNISSNWSSSLHLNTTDSIDTFNYWQNYAPTTNSFYMTGDAALNQNTQDYIAYCFSDVQGFSKMGFYTGNGSADGPFIYTGFKPSFILRKYATGGSAGGEGWEMLDGTRSPFNVADKRLRADTTSAEATGANYYIDFLSNGFKIRTADNATNNSGATYIYMAIAAAPLAGSNNVPANAR